MVSTIASNLLSPSLSILWSGPHVKRSGTSDSFRARCATRVLSHEMDKAPLWHGNSRDCQGVGGRHNNGAGQAKWDQTAAGGLLHASPNVHKSTPFRDGGGQVTADGAAEVCPWFLDFVQVLLAGSCWRFLTFTLLWGTWYVILESDETMSQAHATGSKRAVRSDDDTDDEGDTTSGPAAAAKRRHQSPETGSVTGTTPGTDYFAAFVPPFTLGVCFSSARWRLQRCLKRYYRFHVRVELRCGECFFGQGCNLCELCVHPLFKSRPS